jgi:hypothetical protein
MDNATIGGIIGGAIAGVVTAAVSIIGGLIYLGKRFEKIDSLEKVQGKYEGKIDAFATDIATLKESKANIEKIIDKEIYKAKSPLALTDFGEQLIRESGFSEIFEKEKDTLIGMLEKRDPKTQYDVQETARVLMNELTDYGPFQSIKKYAFDTGKDYGQILRAGAIPLRDSYLEKHREITS